MTKSSQLHISEINSFNSDKAFAEHLAKLLSYSVHDLGSITVFKIPAEMHTIDQPLSLRSVLKPPVGMDTSTDCPLSLRNVVFSFTPSDDRLKDKFRDIYEGYEGKFLFEVNTFVSVSKTKDGYSTEQTNSPEFLNWFSFHLTAVTTSLRQSLTKRAIHSKGDTIGFSPIRAAIRSVMSSVDDEITERDNLNHSAKCMTNLYQSAVSATHPIKLYVVRKSKHRINYKGINGEQMNVSANLDTKDNFNVELTGLSEAQIKALMTTIGVLCESK